jgi:hypothetical protein
MASLLKGLKWVRVHYRGVITGGKCFQRGERNRGRRQCRQVGSTWQRGERGQRVTVQGEAMLGHGLVLAVGWNGSRGPFSYFSFLYFLFFFCFLNSFIDFAKMLQINSNHFQRFYKNHCKVLSQ